jgi:SAM-dependent methyltransferase
MALIKRYCPGDAVFFDVGGGNGFVSKAVQDAGIETVLFEPGPGAVNAKNRGVKNVVSSAFQDVDSIDAPMQAVGLFDVLEHIEDDVKFLSEIYARMGKGGKVFISVPAYMFLWSDEDVDAGHFRRYTLGGLKKKLQAAGFSGVYGTYFFNFLVLPILFLRALPFRMGFKTLKNSLEQRKNEHTAPRGAAGAVIKFLSGLEVKAITGNGKICAGGSCLFVAEKKSDRAY